MGLTCYATLAQLRQRTNPTDTSDDPRSMRKLRAASDDITQYCADRTFQPTLETRTFDWESNDYLSFRAFDLLSLTSLVDGTGNTKAAAALIMLGGRFSDAALWGPWYGVQVDTTKDFLLYNVTRFRCLKVNGVWGYHDDYGASGANAFAPVYTSTTLATALTGTVDGTARVVTTNTDPTASYDGYYQTPGLSAGALVQMDSEWFQVLATSAAGFTVGPRPANGTTAAIHTNAAISVFQPIPTIQEATLRLAQFLLKQDDAPYGRILTPALGQVVIPYKFPPDVEEMLDSFIKRRVA